MCKERIENKFGRVAWDQVVSSLKCPAKEFGLYSHRQTQNMVND